MNVCSRHGVEIRRARSEREDWIMAMVAAGMGICFLPTGEAFQMEQRLRCADGEYRWHLVRRVPLRNENGEVIRWRARIFSIGAGRRGGSSLVKQAFTRGAVRELVGIEGGVVSGPRISKAHDAQCDRRGRARSQPSSYIDSKP